MPESVELPPSSGVETVYTTGDAEYRLAADTPPPTVKPPTRPILEEPPPDYLAVPPKRASLGWAFTNNVFTFPWTQCAVVQWIFASIGLIAAGELGLLAFMGLMSGSQPGVLMAGSLGLGAFWATLLSLSYLAASLFDITVNAAYNSDKAHDWPNADWRERIWYLLRVCFLLALAGVPAFGIAQLSSLAGNFFWPAFAAVEFVLFPVLLLSALEADSLFWPVSEPILGSLLRVGYGWGVFYLLSALLLAGCLLLTVVTFRSLTLLCPLVAGPVLAAAIFIYARLLGRLTWLILRKTSG